MKFKGTIIITDLCYIVKDCTEKNPYPFPWTIDLIHSPNIMNGKLNMMIGQNVNTEEIWKL